MRCGRCGTKMKKVSLDTMCTKCRKIVEQEKK